MTFHVRRAEERDAPVLGQLGALLIRTHYEFDRARFLAAGDDAARGYAWFLRTQLKKDDVAIFVAERDGNVVGYLYAGIEPMSWKELRDEAGFIHDVLVVEEARGGGIASSLIDAASAWFAERHVPRMMLWTAAKNAGAQRLFERLGFRQTMIEMTREIAR